MDNFLVKDGIRLKAGGNAYRAIGVNMPYVTRFYTGQMQAGKAEEKKQAEDSERCISTAADCGFEFVRLFAYPNSPSEIDWYLKNKGRYWERMDKFLLVCQEQGLKLAPSLGMYPWMHYRPYTGENIPAILDPSSRTHELVYSYVSDFVSRYKDVPDILLWEITNEGYLKADKAPTGDQRDLMTYEQFRQFYVEAARFIKSIDSNHLVTSGDACVRTESMLRRFHHTPEMDIEPQPIDNPLRMDSLRDHLSNLLGSQPEPLDVFSLHSYGPSGTSGMKSYRYKDSEGYMMLPGNLRAKDYLIKEIQALHQAGAPVYIGELGQEHPYLNQDRKAEWLMEMIDVLDAEEVSLIAFWVWEFPQQPEYTFNAKSHPELVRKAARFNSRFASPDSSTLSIAK